MTQVTDCYGVTETLNSDDSEFKYVFEAATGALKEMMEIVEGAEWKSKKGWKVEQERPSGDICYSRSGVQKKGKTFIAVGSFDISAQELLDEMWKEMENVPTWNSDILEYRKIMDIAPQTDVTYTVFADAAGGVVKSRDFVDCRCWRKLGDSFVIGGCSVEVKSMPAQKGKVRGEDFAGIFRIRPSSDGKVEVEFTQNTDLKGFIPKSIVERLMYGTILDFLEKLRNRCAAIKKN